MSRALPPPTVTSNDTSSASKGLDTDDQVEHTFASEGDFSYFCTLHSFDRHGACAKGVALSTDNGVAS
jgi:hypothetical protein